MPTHDLPRPAAIVRRRAAVWAYVLGAAAFTAAHVALCFWFALEAWGRRGEAKPWWFHWLGTIATPGMAVPFLGSLLVGCTAGVIVVGIARRALAVVRRPPA